MKFFNIELNFPKHTPRVPISIPALLGFVAELIAKINQVGLLSVRGDLLKQAANWLIDKLYPLI